MANQSYKQVGLVRDILDKEAANYAKTYSSEYNPFVKFQTYVCWVPSKFAVQGKTLRIKNEAGEWGPEWTVSEVYSAKESDWVMEKSRDHKRQRKASDV